MRGAIKKDEEGDFTFKLPNNIFFPLVCFGCGIGMGVPGLLPGFCPECGDRLKEFLEPKNVRLHLIKNSSTEPGMPVLSVFPYIDPIVGMIRSLKFAQAYENANILGTYMAVVWRRLTSVGVYEGIFYRPYGQFFYHGHANLTGLQAISGNIVEKRLPLQPDGVIAVPLHRRRLRQRGYNQADLIASALCRLLNYPNMAGIIVRSKYTKPQTETADRRERQLNVQDAFSCLCREKVKGKCILVIDDVLTGGSTLLSVAACLYAAGAATVIGMVAATDHPRLKDLSET